MLVGFAWGLGIGLVVGATIGVIIMAIFVSNRYPDDALAQLSDSELEAIK